MQGRSTCVVDLGARLHVGAVVDEMSDRDALYEFRHAAVMIAVPMRDDQVVDPGEAGILGGQSVVVIAKAIEQRFNYAQDWPLGSALSVMVV